MLSPVTTEGNAPGNITSRNIANGEAPSVNEAKINLRSIVVTPWIVLSRIGKNAPMKVIKIMLSSELGNIRIASGIHATAGIGRSTSSGDMKRSAAKRTRPTRSRPTAPQQRITAFAGFELLDHREALLRICQNRLLIDDSVICHCDLFHVLLRGPPSRRFPKADVPSLLVATCGKPHHRGWSTR